MLCIIFNIIVMACVFEGSDEIYNIVLDDLNIFFTSVFIFEATCKLIAYG